MRKVFSGMLAAGVAAFIASAAPGHAGPLGAAPAALKVAATALAQDVVAEVRTKRKPRRHYRAYRHGPRYGGYYEYGPRYTYAPRYYGGGSVARGGYPPQECVFDEGGGRFRPCSMGPR